MKIVKISLLILFVITGCQQHNYNINIRKQKIDLGINHSFRGLSIAEDDNSVWIGGTRGCYMTSDDLGLTWKVDSIADCPLDFRSALAKNKNEVTLLSAGSPAMMLRTKDRGRTWSSIFTDNSKNVFFNSMKNRLAIGDPQGSTIDVLYKTGASWERLPSIELPKAAEGESGFAASNTCIDYDKTHQTYWIGLGGKTMARVYRSTDDGHHFEAFKTPLQAGAASGIYSIDFKDNQVGVAVGGSYLKPNAKQQNAIYTKDGGQTWQLSINQPIGYRSCVAHFKERIFVAVGTNGMDLSYDDGENWVHLMDTNLNAIAFFHDSNIAIGVGANGTLYRYEFELEGNHSFFTKLIND